MTDRRRFMVTAGGTMVNPWDRVAEGAYHQFVAG
jgi:hypothetical protein